MYQGHIYQATSKEAPVTGDAVLGVVVPGCNDTGQSLEPDTPVAAYQVGNYCTSDVLAVDDGGARTVYVLAP